jgi:ABC-2 type transport system permease protein
MMSKLQAAWVIARRDFTATVYSRTFFLFLLAPVLILAISGGMGAVSGRMAQQESRPTVAVIATPAQYAEIDAAYRRLKPGYGEYDLTALERFDADYVLSDQAKRLLSAPDKRILAVLSGGVDQPTLTGAIDPHDRTVRQVTAILSDAKLHRALDRAHIQVPPAAVRVVHTQESSGSLATARSVTARIGQTVLFMLTVFLATMVLSNLVEEKSGKIIEILTAAVPVDAIFYGKVGAMLAVSLVGVAVWTAAGMLAAAIFAHGGTSIPQPAVGWTVFIVLVFLYFAANYLLLGALFLGIGSQASTVREVQTLSMPVTMGQLLVFFLATAAAGPFNSALGIGAAIFPFSSPLTMIARAAQTPELWPHLVALVWQALWVWLTIQFGAALFRRNVLKSGGGPAAAFGFRRRRA